MGQKLSPEQNELYKRVDEVLHYVWDPIGVAGEPHARDEYNSYLPKVFSLLLETEDGSFIAEYLMDVESDAMGLTPADRETAEEVTGILIKWKEKCLKGTWVK